MKIHRTVLILAIYVPTLVHLQSEPRPRTTRFRRPASRDEIPIEGDLRPSLARTGEGFLPDLSAPSDIPRPVRAPEYLGERRRSDVRRFRPSTRRRTPYSYRSGRLRPLDPYYRLSPYRGSSERDRITGSRRRDPYERGQFDDPYYEFDRERRPASRRYRTRLRPMRRYYPTYRGRESEPGVPGRRGLRYRDVPYTRSSFGRRLSSDYPYSIIRSRLGRLTSPSSLTPRRGRFRDARRRGTGHSSRRRGELSDVYSDARTSDTYSREEEYVGEPSKDRGSPSGLIFPIRGQQRRDQRMNPITGRNGETSSKLPPLDPPFDRIRRPGPFTELGPINRKNTLTRSNATFPRAADFGDGPGHVRPPPVHSNQDHLSTNNFHQSKSDTNRRSNNTDITSLRDGFLSGTVADPVDVDRSNIGTDDSVILAVPGPDEPLQSSERNPQIKVDYSVTDNADNAKFKTKDMPNTGIKVSPTYKNMNETLVTIENLTVGRSDKLVNNSSETGLNLLFPKLAKGGINQLHPTSSEQNNEQSVITEEQYFDIHNVLKSHPITKSKKQSELINFNLKRRRRIGSANTFIKAKPQLLNIPLPLGVDLSESRDMIVDLTKNSPETGNNIQHRDAILMSTHNAAPDETNIMKETSVPKPANKVLVNKTYNKEGPSTPHSQVNSKIPQDDQSSKPKLAFTKQLSLVERHPLSQENSSLFPTGETIPTHNTSYEIKPEGRHAFPEGSFKNGLTQTESQLRIRKEPPLEIPPKTEPFDTRPRRLRPRNERVPLSARTLHRDELLLIIPENYTREEPPMQKSDRLPPSGQYKDEVLLPEKHSPLLERPLERAPSPSRSRAAPSRPYREEPLAPVSPLRDPSPTRRRFHTPRRYRDEQHLPESSSSPSERPPRGDPLLPRRRLVPLRRRYRDGPSITGTPERQRRPLSSSRRPYSDDSSVSSPKSSSSRDDPLVPRRRLAPLRRPYGDETSAIATAERPRRRLSSPIRPYAEDPSASLSPEISFRDDPVRPRRRLDPLLRSYRDETSTVTTPERPLRSDPTPIRGRFRPYKDELPVTPSRTRSYEEELPRRRRPLSRRPYRDETSYVSSPERFPEGDSQERLSPPRRPYADEPSARPRRERPPEGGRRRRRLLPPRRPYIDRTSIHPRERPDEGERRRERLLPTRRSYTDEPSVPPRRERIPDGELPRRPYTDETSVSPPYGRASKGRLPSPRRPYRDDSSFVPPPERPPGVELPRRRMLPSRRAYIDDTSYITPPERSSGSRLPRRRLLPPRRPYTNETYVDGELSPRRRPPTRRFYTTEPSTAPAPARLSGRERPRRRFTPPRGPDETLTRRSYIPPTERRYAAESVQARRSHPTRERSSRREDSSPTLRRRRLPPRELYRAGSLSPRSRHSAPTPDKMAPPRRRRPHSAHTPSRRRAPSSDSIHTDGPERSREIKRPPRPRLSSEERPRRRRIFPRRRPVSKTTSERRLVPEGTSKEGSPIRYRPPASESETSSEVSPRMTESSSGSDTVAGVRLGVVRARGGERGFPVHGGYCPGERCADGGLAAGVANGTGRGTLEAFLERRRTGDNEDITTYKRELGSLTIT